MPNNGTLVNNGDGTFDYTPELNFVGVDSFIYEICDAEVSPLCDTATVTITVTINNPLPAITALSPGAADAGGADFTLTVDGSNFINDSVVRWNGTDRTTTYISATKLTTDILAADIATAGTSSVTVFNPAPGGGESTPAESFAICSPVMIDGPSPRYYSSLQAAYDDPLTVDGDIIQSRDLVFNEGLIFETAKSVTLEGGFNCDYTDKTGATMLNGMSINEGSITINEGSIIVQDLVIE